jgi:hypothetical protein
MLAGGGIFFDDWLFHEHFVDNSGLFNFATIYFDNNIVEL